jgi:4-aminobutyrate aminotransferase-like enzyme
MVHPPISKELIDVDQVLRVDREHLVHPLSHPADHARPLVIVRGEGAEIIDANGKRYFDALSGLWNVHVGHGRTELAQVAAEQMGTLAFNNNYVGFVNIPSTRLAEKLIEITYSNLNAVSSPPAAPNRTSRPSRPRVSSGSCKASRTRSRSSRADGATTA